MLRFGFDSSTRTHNQHGKGARAVDALDPVQLDVGGGRWAGDQGERLSPLCRTREPADRLGHQPDDLLDPDQAEVIIFTISKQKSKRTLSFY
jgi:hypothetical protein